MRPNFLPDPRFEKMRLSLKERIDEMAAAVNGMAFQGILTPTFKQVLDDGFTRAGAHEGTLWIVDPPAEALVPVFNTGADAAKFVEQFKQPLKAGIVSMVFANEQTFCENEIYKNQLQDPSLDRKLGLRTFAMIVVPFHVAGSIKGVISCVQVRRTADTADPKGFGPNDTSIIRFMSQVLSTLVDHKLLTAATGLDL
jgi:hypothetical protein